MELRGHDRVSIDRRNSDFAMGEREKIATVKKRNAFVDRGLFHGLGIGKKKEEVV